MFLSDINHALFRSVTFFGFQVNFYLNVHCKLAVFDFMAATSHVSNVRSLYKRILVLHRFLPIDLRALGDQYVKDEFRRHKSASPDDVKGFMKEWEVKRNQSKNV